VSVIKLFEDRAQKHAGVSQQDGVCMHHACHLI